MKKQKMLYLEGDIIEELDKLPNASKLINELLNDYFSTGGQLKKAELIKKLGIKKLEIDKLSAEIKDLNNKIASIEENENKLKDAFRSIPEEILEDFKFYPTMTEQILYTRFKEIYSRKYKLDYPTLLEAYNTYFNDSDN